jgi:hypothetical protein
MGDVPGVWDLATGEQVDDCSLVAIRVAEPSVVVQSYDILVTHPRPADPAGLRYKTPGCWQISGRQDPQQHRIGSRLDERC